ncbi:tethering complex subunit PEP3 Ecym_4215 [Eremothecium cymbalariae DBVPG|uniref:RING-type domain-containing protein n=1 Tax=Eremothecium cymbalariae (strain CBS 270.75 / DBVPG 7215 / KCTC 17166 / NRRL Y-17582) TaxID=931890 RepID=G8JTC9_ERECY|nr:hypothetical protein Ecym_4215 [Eremothecium cymbalariae DBVPG\
MKAQIEHVSLDFIKEINNNICSLQIQNNIMCFALKSGQLFIINLSDPSNVVKFQIPLINLNQERLLHIWMNTAGTRVLVKTNFAKYYMCNLTLIIKFGHVAATQYKEQQFFALKKLNRKDCDIISVDWSFDQLQMLVGTRQGKAYYLDLRQGDPSPTRVYLSQSPIDGILWSKTGGAIIVAGSHILYWAPCNSGVVATFTKHPPTEQEDFEALDKESSIKFTAYKDSFAWVTRAGIVFGSIHQKGRLLSSSKMLLSVELPPSRNRIKDVVLTDYYIIILRGSELLIVNQLNNKVVFQEVLFSKEDEKMLYLCADYSQDPATFWCHSTENVYEIVIEKHMEGIWQLLCVNGQFETALNLSGLSQLESDYIRERYADSLYSEGKWLEAAERYGAVKTGSSVGSLALKFMKFDDLQYLQTFLITKFKTIVNQSNQTQIFILSSWIIWNFMNQLNQAEESINEESNDTKLEDLKVIKEKLEKDYQLFVQENLDKLDRETVYQLISQQNRKSELLFFANMIEDYQYVLSYWIRSDNWYESLKVLVTLQDAESVYKYGTILLINAPDAAVNTWVQIPNVDPVELIPSMLAYFNHYQEQQRLSHRPLPNYALVYLKWCIKEHDSQDSLIHNTAIYMLLVSMDTDDLEGEQEVIKFMSDYASKFDHNFILRLSLKFRRYSVAIYIYSELKLYDNAVDLALSNGMITSAKIIVGSLESEDTYTLKKLWLKIARVMIHEDKDMKESIRTIIEDSNKILSIKDLLPLFNELTTIANLKEELIRSLEKHRSSMSHIFEEINGSIKIKKEIKQDIELFNKRHQSLRPGVSCDICEKLLPTRKFFVFPCGHNFHTDCMIKEIIKSNEFNMRSQIESYQRRLARHGKQSVNVRELDSLLSTKCCLCSDIKINTIDEPLQEEDDKENELAWEL